MTSIRSPPPPSLDQPIEFRKKDGTLSKMRCHRGNIPILPQTKLCPHCPAKFTRTTHLNRHLRTHTGERLHHCDTCDSQFTRSDLLTRHKKSCNDPLNRTRRKSCISCTESKIKCDRQYPCAKCTTRGRECLFASPGKRHSFPSQPVRLIVPILQPEPTSPSSSSTTPSSAFAPTPEASHSYYNGPLRIHDSEDNTHANYSILPHFATVGRKSISPAHYRDPKLDFYSSSSSDLDAGADSDQLVPVNSHLSSAYASDMFEPFFSTIFSQPPLPTTSITDVLITEDVWTENGRSGSPEEFPFNAQSGNDARARASPLNGGQGFLEMLGPPRIEPASNNVRPSSAALELSRGDPPPAELEHYLYLFFSAFLSQIPIVHGITFGAENKPPVLLGAMQACGALFVKTRKATTFILKTLASAREALVLEFAKDSSDSSDQVHLILAVVLLQTIGLFHQRSDQRASSSIYHGMLVMMIRRTGLMSKSGAWEPGKFEGTPIDALWRDWVKNEMTKRALLWSYMHDCCHCIYFALPSSYHPSEIELNLPCEDALWEANSAAEWYMVLQSPSPYGDCRTRLTGLSIHQTLATLGDTHQITAYIPVNPFAHFVLIHAILRHLFVVCLESRLPKLSSAVNEEEGLNHEIFGLQYALHNWLQNWMNSPDTSKINDPNDEPPFIHNVLPFYWLGQVSLLAHQEGLPPFEFNSPNNLKTEVRFRMVKQWLKHIRGFLKRSDEAPTLFWDELMKIRLQTWQVELESDTTEDQDGLLGFFPEH